MDASLILNRLYVFFFFLAVAMSFPFSMKTFYLRPVVSCHVLKRQDMHHVFSEWHFKRNGRMIFVNCAPVLLFETEFNRY